MTSNKQYQQKPNRLYKQQYFNKNTIDWIILVADSVCPFQVQKFKTLGSHDRRTLQLVADLCRTVWCDEADRWINQRGYRINRRTFYFSSGVIIIFYVLPLFNANLFPKVCDSWISRQKNPTLNEKSPGKVWSNRTQTNQSSRWLIPGWLGVKKKKKKKLFTYPQVIERYLCVLPKVALWDLFCLGALYCTCRH